MDFIKSDLNENIPHILVNLQLQCPHVHMWHLEVLTSSYDAENVAQISSNIPGPLLAKMQ